MMPGMLASQDDTSAQAGAPAITRRQRVVAILIDLAILASLAAFALGIGMAWLLLRTGFGAEDPTSRDTHIAFGLLMATVPMWLTFVGRELILTASTPGQRHAKLAVQGSQRIRLVRLITHPIAAVGWLWLALIANLATLPLAPLFFTSAATIPILGGLITTLIALRSPTARGIHDHIAGTRLVAR